MGKETAISWTDHTFNPWWGCSKVSPACTHCYAETFSKRIGLTVWGNDSERRFFGDKHWAEPVKWNAAAAKAGVRRRVFCASMADVFERRVDLEPHRWRLWQLIINTPMLDWLLLTKRPDAISDFLPEAWQETPQPNVWLGTTVESQCYADERIPLLLKIPAAVRFISAEPLLGPVDLRRFVGGEDEDGHCIRCGCAFEDGVTHDDCPPGFGPRLDWVIAGGESGAGCRVSDPQWIRSLRDQCHSVGVAFHFKQWGGFYAKANGCDLDGREWKDFPHTATERTQ